MRQEFTTKSVLALQKPDKLSSVLQSGMMGATVVSDGKTICTYLPMFGKYTVQDVKGPLSELVSHPALEGPGFPILRTLASEKPYELLMEGVTNGLYIGMEDVSGVQCHRLRFGQDEMDWDVWIEAGDRPLPRKFVPDFSKMMEAVGGQMPGGKPKDVKMDIVETLDNWQVGTNLPASLFAFIPPAGSEKVDSFFPEGDGGLEDGGEIHPLLGKPAPAFKVETLAGRPFDMAAQTKKVVILDFWATWCGPCRRAMPVVIEVADAYKSKGVVLCAVNQGEGKEQVKEFIEKQGLACLVGLDPEGKVGELYRVEGIPQTVIVGKDGRVQVVHVGFSPSLKKDLTDALDALLAGKDLAKDAMAVKQAPGAELGKPGKRAVPPAAELGE
jgi:thiol-disulfide isomerase/thioredoxin